MLERVIDHISSYPGVKWATLEEMAESFRRRQPFTGG